MNEIQIFPGVARGRLAAPPSKSYTHRALVAAFLSGRTTRIVTPLDSEDTRATACGLGVMGREVDLGTTSWSVGPPERAMSARRRTIRCGQSGTTLRFLLALAALGRTPYRVTAEPQLTSRPIGPLLTALENGGATIRRTRPNAGVPVTLCGPIQPGTWSVDCRRSSQFLSALLLVLPTLPGPSRIQATGGLVSAPYVEATLASLREQGISVTGHGPVFQIPGSQKYRGGRIDIPGDASSAAYLWAAAAVTGGKVRVDGITARWPQADLAILRVLADAGALVVRRGPSVTVEGGLSGPVEAELDGAPDLLPLIGAVAAVTPGRHRIRGAGHAALKESDRRKETVRLVRALGGRAEAGSRLLRIDGTARPRPIRVPDWRDHRMVMSAAVAALAASGPSTVGRASAVRKSFPGFWSAIRTLGVRWEEVR